MSVPDEVETIARILHKAKRQCWLVGGAVRDASLGQRTLDYDLATDAPPAEIQKLFRRTIPTGIKHGTVTILIGKHSFETTTFRSEGSYSDGRHPDTISWTSDIQQDLSRRDFTINAMAWNILKRELYDPFDAVNDLRNKCIRAIGNPAERFNEDTLRVIRACRLSAQLEFDIEPETLAAIRLVLPDVKNLSAERIWDEIKKVFAAPRPSIAFMLFQQTGLMKELIPELYSMKDSDRFKKALIACDTAPLANLPVRAAALLHGIQFEDNLVQPVGKTITKKILKRFKASGKETQTISRLVQFSAFPNIPMRDDAAVRHYLVATGTDLIDDLHALYTAITKSDNPESTAELHKLEEFRLCVKRILQQKDPLTIQDLAIDGKDLMNNLALKPSPVLGKLLNNLLTRVLDNPELNSRDTLLDIARQLVENPGT